VTPPQENGHVRSILHGAHSSFIRHVKDVLEYCLTLRDRALTLSIVSDDSTLYGTPKPPSPYLKAGPIRSNIPRLLSSRFRWVREALAGRLTLRDRTLTLSIVSDGSTSFAGPSSLQYLKNLSHSFNSSWITFISLPLGPGGSRRSFDTVRSYFDIVNGV
jgi:hypothetical protein